MPTLSPKVTPYYGGGQAVDPANVIKVTTTPGTTLTQDRLGTIAINNAAALAYMLVSKSGGLDTWSQITFGGGASSFATVTSAGNITITGSGSGFVTNPVVGTTGGSPITANGRIVAATFTGVSIAAGATQSLVITNSAVTVSTQIGLTSWSGATAGAALTLQSVVNAAGTSTFTFTNGTGATTSVANITIIYELLN